MENAGVPDPGAVDGGGALPLLSDYTEDEDEGDTDTTEMVLRRHLPQGENMEVEDQGAVGGASTDIKNRKEGQNLSPESPELSQEFDESLSDKARAYILKNRTSVRSDGGIFGKVNLSDGKNSAVPPPRPPVPLTTTLSSSASECDTKINNKLDFPSQFFTIRAARFRSQKVTTLGGVPGFSRSGGDSGRPDVGFRVDGDMRSFTIMNFHRTDANRNISSSVTVDLGCLACATPHSIKDNASAGLPIVVVLADQAFPPMIPGRDGKCIVIIRVEDGFLFELEQAFVDIFVELLGPRGSLSRGSVILVGSVSHLGGRGLVSYATDLCGTLASLANKTASGVEVIPFVPVPVCGRGGGAGLYGTSSIWMPGSWAPALVREFGLRGPGGPSGRLWAQSEPVPATTT
jgi:hypothetical protein